MKAFYLNRINDITGTSGTGIVCQGVMDNQGRILSVWQSETPSFTIHESLEAARSIHGHDGNSEYIFTENSKTDPELFPTLADFYHNENRSGLSGVGKVGEIAVCNNGWVIFQWTVAPFQVEVFTKIEDFYKVHLKDYCSITIL